MENQKKTLAAVLFKSVGAGHGALNMAGHQPELEVIEASPVGERSQILVCGSDKAVGQFIVRLRTLDLQRTVIIADLHAQVLPSYLSLQCARLAAFALVIESDFVGDLLANANDLLKMGLAIVDFRVFRGGGPTGNGCPCHLILTGPDVTVAETWVNHHEGQIKNPQHRFSLHQNLSPTYKKHLDLLVP